MKKAALVCMGCLAIAALANAKPGEGIRYRNLAISPFVDVSATYDSNVFLTGVDEKNDIYWDIIPGIAFINRTDSTILRGRGWGQFRRYSDYDELDVNSFGERLGFTAGTAENPLLSIEEKFMRLEDYEIYPRNVDTLNVEGQSLALTEDRTERVKRKIFDIGAVAGHGIGDKMRLDVGYGYSFVNYDQTDLFDWQEDRVQAEGQYELTEKTSALLTGQYAVQDGDGFDGNSSLFLVRLGFFSHTTGKTTVKAGVGYQKYDAAEVSALGESLNDSFVNFDVAGVWNASPKLKFQVSGRNGDQPATQYERNTKRIMLLSAGMLYDVTDTVLFSLAGSHRQDDYVGQVLFDGVPRDKQRTLWGGRARIDYRPHAKFYELYLEGSYENVHDNLQDDYENYNQARITAGIFVRY